MSTTVIYDDLFVRSEDNAEFNKSGFLPAKYNIGADLTAAILEYYNTIFNDISLQDGFSTVFSYYGINDRMEIHRHLLSLLKPFVEMHCKDCEVYLSNFMIKTPSDEFTIDIHQDWTYVDESRYRSFNCWIPLADTNMENGGLVIAPGTHFRNIKTFRSPNIPLFFSDNTDLIMDYLFPVPVKKGDAVFFDNSIVHGATSNNSATDRVSVVLCLKQKKSEMLFLHAEKEGIEVYKQKDDYIFHFENYIKDIFKRPSTGILSEVLPDSVNKTYTQVELEAVLDGIYKELSLCSPSALDKYKCKKKVEPFLRRLFRKFIQ